MPTYWDAFCKEYKDRMYLVPIVRILEAFFYYEHGDKPASKEIFDRSTP